METGRHWSNMEKNAFRAKAPWKKFRAKILRDRGCKCEMCRPGASHTAKSLDLHHLRPDLYDLLDPKLFKLLCTKHHELVEWMAIQLEYGDVPNQEAAMAWLGPFLPKVVRTIDKYMTKESMLSVDSLK